MRSLLATGLAAILLASAPACTEDFTESPDVLFHSDTYVESPVVESPGPRKIQIYVDETLTNRFGEYYSSAINLVSKKYEEMGIQLDFQVSKREDFSLSHNEIEIILHDSDYFKPTPGSDEVPAATALVDERVILVPPSFLIDPYKERKVILEAAKEFAEATYTDAIEGKISLREFKTKNEGLMTVVENLSSGEQLAADILAHEIAHLADLDHLEVEGNCMVSIIDPYVSECNFDYDQQKQIRENL